VIAYKFLRAGRVGSFSGVSWPDPAEDRSWVAATGRHRVHACLTDDLPAWAEDELWRVELDGHVATGCGMLAADRGRLVERIAGWDAAVAAELALATALRARDFAVDVLRACGHAEHADALAGCSSARDVRDVAGTLAARTTLATDAARAAAYLADTANKAVRALDEPGIAPSLAAGAGFIAGNVAAIATGDYADAPLRERAWQGQWLAERLALASSS
jgi:hypothetical protein